MHLFNLSLLFLCTIILSTSNLYAGSEGTEEELSKCLTDSCKIANYYQLAWDLRKGDLESAQLYAEKGIKLSRKLNQPKNIATGLNRLGIVFKNKGQLNEAIHCYNEALEIEKKQKHTFGIARAYHQLSKAYKEKGNYAKALEYAKLNLEYMLKTGRAEDIANSQNALAVLLINKGEYKNALIHSNEALKIYVTLNSKEGQALTHQNLGNLYEVLEEYKKAEYHQQKSLSFNEEISDDYGVADALNNLGNIYFFQKKTEKAESYYRRSIRLKKELNDEKGLQGSYFNLGLILEAQGKFLEAIDLHKENLLLAETKEDAFSKERLLFAIGDNYQSISEYETSERYLKDAYAIAKMNQSTANLRAICTSLAGVYESTNRFDEAFKYLRESEELNEELTNEFREVKQLETELLNQKMNNAAMRAKSKIDAAQLKEADLSNRNSVLTIIILLVTFMGVGLGVFFWLRSYRHKQKMIVQSKESQIKHQAFEDRIKENELTYRESVIEAQENERKRISEELHDNLGGLLSTVKFQFQTIEEAIGELADQPSKMYQKAIDLLDEACEAVRVVAHQMSSVDLEKYGLILELNGLFDSYRSTGKLEVNSSFHNLKERLPVKVERELYKTIRELMTNVLKHSRATKVNVNIVRHNGDLTLVFEDNGIGFDVEQMKQGLGLFHIERRFAKLNGTVNIDSGKGNGTTIAIDLTIPKKNEL